MVPAIRWSRPCSKRGPIPEHQGRQAVRVAQGQLQGQHAAERHAENSRAFQPEPGHELVEVLDEIAQPKAPAEGETIVLAPELVGDHPEAAGQPPGQRPEQLEAAGQAGDQDQRRPFPPGAVMGGVLLEVGHARLSRARTEFRAARRQPINRCLQASLPFRCSGKGVSLWAARASVSWEGSTHQHALYQYTPDPPFHLPFPQSRHNRCGCNRFGR